MKISRIVNHQDFPLRETAFYAHSYFNQRKFEKLALVDIRWESCQGSTKNFEINTEPLSLIDGISIAKYHPSKEGGNFPIYTHWPKPPGDKYRILFRHRYNYYVTQFQGRDKLFDSMFMFVKKNLHALVENIKLSIYHQRQYFRIFLQDQKKKDITVVGTLQIINRFPPNGVAFIQQDKNEEAYNEISRQMLRQRKNREQNKNYDFIKPQQPLGESKPLAKANSENSKKGCQSEKEGFFKKKVVDFNEVKFTQIKRQSQAKEQRVQDSYQITEMKKKKSKKYSKKKEQYVQNSMIDESEQIECSKGQKIEASNFTKNAEVMPQKIEQKNASQEKKVPKKSDQKMSE